MPAPQRRSTWRAMPEATAYAISKKRLDILIEIAFRSKKPSAKEVKSFKSDIAAATKTYVITAHQHKGPTQGQILAALSDLQNAARSLDQVVRSMDDAAFEALLQQDEKLAKSSRHRRTGWWDRSTFEENFWAVRALVSETKMAARWLVRKSAPPMDKDLKLGWKRNPFVRGPRTFDEFIAHLGEIYQRYSGSYPWETGWHKPNLRMFLAFVTIALPPGERTRTDLSVGRTIENVFPKPTKRLSDVPRKPRSKKVP